MTTEWNRIGWKNNSEGQGEAYRMATTARPAKRKAKMKLGININGNRQWSPAQYVIDAGWDYACVEATARLGISSEDADHLTEDEQARLLAYCQQRVEDQRGPTN